MKKNLRLVSQLMAQSNYVLFRPQEVRVYRNIRTSGAPIMEGCKLESIYIMSIESAYVEKTQRNETVDLGHTRLGHVSYHKLKSMVGGFSEVEVQTDTICVGCQFGKAHQFPYQPSKYQAKEPLELVHSVLKI